MTNSLEIKNIQKEDLADLSLLYEELSNKKSELSVMSANSNKILTNENYILIGAKQNGKLLRSLMGIICYDLVGNCNPFMVIENVIVSKTGRGMGIGKKLMLHIEQIAKDKNCNYIFFVSASERLEAHKFYESLGYCPSKVKGFKKTL